MKTRSEVRQEFSCQMKEVLALVWLETGCSPKTYEEEGEEGGYRESVTAAGSCRSSPKACWDLQASSPHHGLSP